MAISVGPTLFVIIKYSLSYSYKAGLAFVFGVSLSDFIYVALANIAAPLLEGLKPYERYSFWRSRRFNGYRAGGAY